MPPIATAAGARPQETVPLAQAAGSGCSRQGVGRLRIGAPPSDEGKRRRARLRDKARHLAHQAGDTIETTAKDMSHRARGLVAKTQARFRSEAVTDDVLVARVRSKMGRVVSHPRALTVTAHEGRVTLTGPILAGEVDTLLAAIADVPGVVSVENRLEVHETADNIPALQGGRRMPGETAGWPPTARVLAGTAGGALAAYGAKRRDAVGAALGTVGLGLLARGLANIEMKRLIGTNGGHGAVDFEKTINIAAPTEGV